MTLISLPIQLLMQYLDMMNSMQMITCECKESDELSIIQSLVRILVGCLKSSNPDVCGIY